MKFQQSWNTYQVAPTIGMVQMNCADILAPTLNCEQHFCIQCGQKWQEYGAQHTKQQQFSAEDESSSGESITYEIIFNSLVSLMYKDPHCIITCPSKMTLASKYWFHNVIKYMILITDTTSKCWPILLQIMVLCFYPWLADGNRGHYIFLNVYDIRGTLQYSNIGHNGCVCAITSHFMIKASLHFWWV